MLVSLYDLLSPQFSGPTILRQAQTAMLTENFVREGFSLKGLYLNIHGNDKPLLVYEFPIYNFAVGLLFRTINYRPIWGQLVSLLASIGVLVISWKLARDRYGDLSAFFTGLFFVLSPLGVMMRTAFQPDAAALMFSVLALYILNCWHSTHSLTTLLYFCIVLLLGGLTKYPVVVPYMPLMALAFFSKNGKFRLPTMREVVTVFLFFIIPMVAWYVYRGYITHPDFADPARYDKFLIGDLGRFFSLSYYTIPLYLIVVLACSGIGIIFLVLGLNNMSPVKCALLCGIPLYFIIVPTVSVQHYYFYACTPIVAFFMAEGLIQFRNYCNGHRMYFVMYGAYALYLLIFLVLSFYIMVTRQDTVLYEAAHAVQKISEPNDLIFVMNMHNRTNGFGGNNPTFFYISQRKGWTISPTFTVESSLKQVAERRNEGAKWLVITWYTPEIEPAIEYYIPASANTKVDPGIDGRRFYRELIKIYPVAFESKNYAVLKLS